MEDGRCKREEGRGKKEETIVKNLVGLGKRVEKQV